MNAGGALFPVEDWLLTPEGAIVHPPARIAVIADVHLGYEWACGKAGDSIPAHSLNETLAGLDRLFYRIPETISTLIVAGDLVESRRPCRRTLEDVREFRLRLDRRGVKLRLLAGNHDPRHILVESEQQVVEDICEVAGWTIGHGHQPIPGKRTISGHIHPVFRFSGVTAPCFLVGPDTLVLPAFSKNAAGLDVLAHVKSLGVNGSKLRCVVGTGDEILDFGPLGELISRTWGAGSFVRGETGR